MMESNELTSKIEIESNIESRLTALEGVVRVWRDQGKNENKRGKNSHAETTVW